MIAIFVKMGNFNFQTTHVNAETQTISIHRELHQEIKGTKITVMHKTSFASEQMAAIF